MSEKSFHDRVAAVVAGQKVEELKARHAYLHGVNRGREEYGTFWLRSDHSTFGHTFGRMMGYKELVPAHFGEPLAANAFAKSDEKYGMDDDNMKEGMPFENATEEKIDRPTKMRDIYGMFNLYGHNPGTFGQSCHVLASPVIEVAEDGKSARSFYLTPGTMMGMNGPKGGRSGGWLWERYGSDFVYRDGRWWWFHEQVCPDIAGDYDCGNWAHDRYMDYLDRDLNIGELGGRPAQLTEPGLFHADYSITQTVQDTVHPPVPYATLDDNNTYSPGRTDPTGKVTVKSGPATKLAFDPDENPFAGKKPRKD